MGISLILITIHYWHWTLYSLMLLKTTVLTKVLEVKYSFYFFILELGYIKLEALSWWYIAQDLKIFSNVNYRYISPSCVVTWVVLCTKRVKQKISFFFFFFFFVIKWINLFIISNKEISILSYDNVYLLFIYLFILMIYKIVHGLQQWSSRIDTELFNSVSCVNTKFPCLERLSLVKVIFVVQCLLIEAPII